MTLLMCSIYFEIVFPLHICSSWYLRDHQSIETEGILGKDHFDVYPGKKKLSKAFVIGWLLRPSPFQAKSTDLLFKIGFVFIF